MANATISLRVRIDANQRDGLKSCVPKACLCLVTRRAAQKTKQPRGTDLDCFVALLLAMTLVRRYGGPVAVKQTNLGRRWTFVEGGSHPLSTRDFFTRFRAHLLIVTMPGECLRA